MATVQTLTLYPSGYVSDDYSYASISNVGNGNTESSSTTYAQINLKTGSSAETYLYYTFDTSAIPEDAVVCEVTCTAKAMISQSNTRYVTTKTMQLYSGTTAKGSATSMTTTASELSVTAGDWTLDELSNIRLKLYAKRGTSSTSTSIYIRFYGATLTIKYVIPETISIVGNTTIGGVTKEMAGGYANLGGVWKGIVRSYANVDGVWVPTWKDGEISFTWKKYNVSSSSTTTYSQSQSTAKEYTSSSVWTDDNMDTYTSCTVYTTMNFDTSTGDYIFSNSIGTVTSLSKMKTYTQTYGTVYVYLTVGNTSKGDAAFEYDSDGYLKRISLFYQKNTTTTESQGSYIGEVTSSSYTAYPENGKHTDGYWYIRQ